jgi:hypothetical protein
MARCPTAGSGNLIRISFRAPCAAARPLQGKAGEKKGFILTEKYVFYIGNEKNTPQSLVGHSKAAFSGVNATLRWRATQPLLAPSLNDDRGMFPFFPRTAGEWRRTRRWPFRRPMDASDPGCCHAMRHLWIICFFAPALWSEDGTWRYSSYGQNATDRYYWTHRAHACDTDVRYAGMPATFGATVSYRFH